MKIIDDLRQAGFDIRVDEENIRYKQKDKSEIDNAWLDNVLREISANKAKIIEYLRQIEQKPIDKSKKPEVVTPSAEGWKSIDDCLGCLLHPLGRLSIKWRRKNFLRVLDFSGR